MCLTDGAETLESRGQAVEPEIDNRRGVQGEQLADQQTAHNRDSQGMTQFRSCASTKSQRQTAEQRCHGGHHDGTETQQAGLKNCFLRWFVFDSFRFEGEVNHHDGVLLHDANQQNDPDQANDTEIVAGDQQRQDGSDAGGGQSREDGDGMNVALVQNSQHDINRDDGGQD